MRMYGLSHIQHFWESTKDTRLLLAWSRTTVVLAFRGTASLKNAQTDLSVREQSSAWLCAQIFVGIACY